MIQGEVDLKADVDVQVMFEGKVYEEKIINGKFTLGPYASSEVELVFVKEGYSFN